MKLYQADIPVWATVYVKAESEEAAKKKVLELAGLCINEHDGESEVEFSSQSFDDPDLPEISLSPAMTIATKDQMNGITVTESE